MVAFGASVAAGASADIGAAAFHVWHGDDDLVAVVFYPEAELARFCGGIGIRSAENFIVYGGVKSVVSGHAGDGDIAVRVIDDERGVRGTGFVDRLCALVLVA